MKKILTTSLLVLAMTGLPAVMQAEEQSDEKVTFEIGADVVSSYIWRGSHCGGFSVQPGATVTWNQIGLSVGAWASAELFDSNDWGNMTEIDLFVEYSLGDFTATLTDLYFYEGKYLSDWSYDEDGLHCLDLALSYDFGPLSLMWSTCIGGPDHQEDGDRIFSTYIEVTAPFTLGGVECEATVGACPWRDGYINCCGGEEATNKFNVINCTLGASKEIKDIPFFTQLTYNPYTDNTYFVVGVSF